MSAIVVAAAEAVASPAAPWVTAAALMAFVAVGLHRKSPAHPQGGSRR